ncbi:MAG TPA: DNA repair protein RadC [Acidobacteriota bacterium]|nr:DNA repair protein RadC [Acidobacteriota bacterium]
MIGKEMKVGVDWVKEDSPEARGYNRGTAILSKQELLSLMVSETEYASSMERAKRVMELVPSLRRLSTLPPSQLRKCGLSVRESLLVAAIFELARRYAEEKIRETEFISEVDEAYEFLKPRLRDLSQESFGAIFLNQKNGIICYKELFRGTINASAVHPREIVREALRENAAAVILAHNHPSGNTNPSEEDLSLTTTLENVLNAIDVRVLDHIIVGGDGYFSFAQKKAEKEQGEDEKKMAETKSAEEGQ